MYNNAGKSIKNMVNVVVGIQMALFIILGIILMVLVPDGAGFFVGLIIAGAGCFFAWLSGLLLYAFGDIADSVKMLTHMSTKLTVDVVKDDADTSYAEAVELSINDRNISKFQRNMIKEYREQLQNGVLSPEQYKSKVESIVNEGK